MSTTKAIPHPGNAASTTANDIEDSASGRVGGLHRVTGFVVYYAACSRKKYQLLIERPLGKECPDQPKYISY